MKPEGSFDVFLCHNSQDKSTVESIARRLQKRGLRPWLDVWELRPGLPWQRALEEQIRQIGAAAVFVGARGLGPWQDLEVAALLRQFVKRGCPVIPVLLPDCPEAPELPVFLEGMTWVDFRQDPPDPMDQLAWGITGRKPDGSIRKTANAIHDPRPASASPPKARPIPPERYDLRLVIHRDGDGFHARWTGPDGQESETFPLLLPLSRDDTADLRWYLETYPQFPGAGDHVRAGELQTRIQDWGRALFDTVFGSPEGVHVYRDLVDAVDRDRPSLVTIGATDPEILAQPWEMMRDKRGPLVFQGVTLRRQLQGAGRPRPSELPLPLRVLLIVSRPSDMPVIDPRSSMAPVLDALDALPAGQVEVEFCEPPTMARLEKIISEARKAKRPFGIVHFDGHGTYMPHTGIGALAFEKSDYDDKAELVPGSRLGDLLTRLDMPVVILEASRSSDLSNRPVFGSVAPALLESGVGSVLAFSHHVHMKAARLFVERFYRELTGGMTVGQALEEARAGLHADSHRPLHLGPDPATVELHDWFVPQLYQVGADPALLRGAGGDTPVPTQSSPREKALRGFPPPPMYRFHGRGLELLELERAFRRRPAVLLTGMGGMGKTALAREAADWWLRKRRFEVAVFHSFEQKAGADRVVQVLGQAFEGEEFSARPAAEHWPAAVDLFRERRVLLVWDMFESTLPMYQRGAGQPGEDASESGDAPFGFGSKERQRLRKLYRELTEGDPAGRLLVTCRPQETGLPGIKEIELSGLARPDSLHLLSAVLYQKSISTDRKGYEREAIEDLLKTLADHPLSIELVTPHLKTMPPSAIQGELRENLERFADASAEEPRNRSLLASLAFSMSRLSEPARAVLPYLAWFEGGVFEQLLIFFAELQAEVWEAIRAELETTALIRVDEGMVRINNRPFIRLHPTLAYAARLSGKSVPGIWASVADEIRAAETRFIEIYLGVMRMVDQFLRGAQPAGGMVLLALEEANFRSALRRTFRRGARQEGARIAATLDTYLQMAGRLRERADFAAWVRSQMPEEAGLDEAACAAVYQHAMGLVGQAQTDEAIATVRDLVARLKVEGLASGENPTFQIAASYYHLGQINVYAHQPNSALEPLQQAIGLLEGLSGDAAKGNLAVALGNLANAYRALGQLDKALAAVERALAINRELGNNREVAVTLAILADVLMKQQRYAEANARNAEALDAARSAGDIGLQGVILQHQAGMQDEMGNHGRAIELGKEALTRFQKAGHVEGERGICSTLGEAERKLGHLGAAEAWHARARELAEKTKSQFALAVIALHAGILHQTRADQTGDPEERDVHLRRAVSLIEESLDIRLRMNDQVNAAYSYSELGRLHRRLGEFDRAEEYLQQGLRIFKPLNLPDVWKNYAHLAEVARARGDTKAAAVWEAKRDAKIAELQRLRRGDGA